MSGQMQKFSVSADSRVLTPDVPGLAILRAALASGAAIHARQSGPDPIAPDVCAPPWLTCETSGSSGPPKVIRRSPASWIASFKVMQNRFAIGPGDTYLTFGSLGHSLPLYAVIEASHLGADIALCPNPARADMTDGADEHLPTVIYATPTQLRLYLAHQSPGAKLRWVFAGGGKLDTATRQLLQNRAPQAPAVEFFGASETSFITLSDHDTPQGSVGRAYPGVDLRIGPGGLPPHKTAELWVRSPYLFQGYASGGSGDTEWRDGYLSIGELGYLDSAGHLFLRGRKNRMFTVADKNVFPEEIEATIARFAGVRHCAVVPRSDAQRGHVAICFLEARGPLDLARLRQLCRTAHGAHSVPREFRILPEIPLLAAGKPDLTALTRLSETPA